MKKTKQMTTTTSDTQKPGTHRLIALGVMLALGTAGATQAATSPSNGDATEFSEMFSKGHVDAYARTIYFHSQNAYNVPGLHQDTAIKSGDLYEPGAGNHHGDCGV